MINPDARLREHARAQGWRIRDYRTGRKAARAGLLDRRPRGRRHRRRRRRRRDPPQGPLTPATADSPVLITAQVWVPCTVAQSL